VSLACSFIVSGTQIARCSPEHPMLKPSFSEHRYPHASPPVTEPANGAFRAIREDPPQKYAHSPLNYPTNGQPAMQPTTGNQEPRTRNQELGKVTLLRKAWEHKCVRLCGLVGRMILPESVGGEACSCRGPEKEGFTNRSVWRAPCYLGARDNKTARCGHLRAFVGKAFSLLLFLCRRRTKK
jgi:hypothetical protein